MLTSELRASCPFCLQEWVQVEPNRLANLLFDLTFTYDVTYRMGGAAKGDDEGDG